ncbi:MAG: AAA family ATPase [Ktedonobacter sp. 13_1_40CM_4_52_4]|nr:MAG: AAA family ATPase [Ktedonobacter sp. 13_1_40CM_4_52_4]OLE40581.1 MAG: AAA family ATPase [Cyanobacteria bacterium 13_1_40CM_2_61_4]
MKDWWIYKGTGEPHDGINRLPKPPGWRRFGRDVPDELPIKHEITPQVEQHLGEKARGAKFQANDEEINLINAALYLRRPLFITGKPGCGKSSLAYAVAYELKLGPVLYWPITTRVTLKDSLYYYDAIGRLHAASLASKDSTTLPNIGEYLRLGPLGTALLPSRYPRVLLIDEIDKSDIDLPNDLLNIFEEGEYYIPELARMAKQSRQTAVMLYGSADENEPVVIEAGHVRCSAFPFIVLTSNEEREFPPAFLRRCIRMEMQPPDEEKLANIIRAHLGDEVFLQAEKLIRDFIPKFTEKRALGNQATDQLLNAIYLITQPNIGKSEAEVLLSTLLQPLTSTEAI